MLPARADAACSSSCRARPPENGWMERLLSMAICSISSPSIKATPRFATRWKKRSAFLANPAASMRGAGCGRLSHRTISGRQPRSSLRCRAPFRVRWPRRICAPAPSERAFLALPSLSSRLLLPSRCRAAPPSLARASRRGHRCRRDARRTSAHLSRPRWRRQSPA